MIGAKEPFHDPFDVGVPNIERIFFSQMRDVTLGINRDKHKSRN
jgi:hypothetical protein